MGRNLGRIETLPTPVRPFPACLGSGPTAPWARVRYERWPTVKDLKPVSLADISSKITCLIGDMTQAHLGDAIRVTRQTIIAIEQGRYSPSLESAFRIARVFGVGIEDVFTWDTGRRERYQVKP